MSNDQHDSRPNILFILTDDQGAWAMANAGNNEILTPNLDRLAATGMRFDNFFCASPVCSPARASLLTGRIPSQHGVHDWLSAGNTVSAYEPAGTGELIEYLQGQTGYTDVLASSGYVCGISGKWHLGDSHHSQKGFTFWNVHAKGGGPYYHAPMVRSAMVYEEPGYVTDVITDNAIHWLETRREEVAPFYLSVHYTAPHSPWSRENHPKETFDTYFNECPFTSVPNGITPPEWARYLSIPCRDEADRRMKLSGYYTAVTEMDRNVGRLVDWLEDAGLRERTLIIFTSDNGMNMGHHGVYGKGNATFPMNRFDTSVKVPFLASQPGVIPLGVVNTNLVSQYDFMPTLLEYAGVSFDQYTENADTTTSEDRIELPGESFASSLRGNDESDGREDVVVFDEYGPVRMVRTKRWKYVHRYMFGPNELYDLYCDPDETTNLIDVESTRSVQNELRDRLVAWFERFADPARDGAGEVVTGSGQLGLCGADSDGISTFSIDRVSQFLDDVN